MQMAYDCWYYPSTFWRVRFLSSTLIVSCVRPVKFATPCFVSGNFYLSQARKTEQKRPSLITLPTTLFITPDQLVEFEFIGQLVDVWNERESQHR